MTEPSDALDAGLTLAGWASFHLLHQVRAWAFFKVDRQGAHLLASDRIDQGCFGHIAPLASLGDPAPPVHADVAPIASPPRAQLLLIFPRLVAGREHGLLYLEGIPPGLRIDRLLCLDMVELEVVLRTCTSAARSAPLDFRPDDSIERIELLLLLEREEWSISRVARRLGVTRATVYNRMQRHSIPSKKERRAATARRAAPDGPTE